MAIAEYLFPHRYSRKFKIDYRDINGDYQRLEIIGINLDDYSDTVHILVQEPVPPVDNRTAKQKLADAIKEKANG